MVVCSIYGSNLGRTGAGGRTANGTEEEAPIHGELEVGEMVGMLGKGFTGVKP